MSLPQIENFRQLFLDNVDLLDVRAPVEYAQGAFPHSQNMPLLNDEERHQVGLRYKTQGQDKAIELGYQLVSDEVKSSRLDAWEHFFQQHPNGILYCFRGGMRSKITQQWLYEKTGKKFPRIKGGYKALRQFLLQQLESAAATMPFVVLSGRTGSGKTLLLDQVEGNTQLEKIDLEKLYHHRGSVFGQHVEPQPSQIDIENTLAVQLLKMQQNKHCKLLLEDESPCIGARRLPDNIVNAMRHAPILLLETDADERIDIIFDEYITQALNEHVRFYGEATGFDKWAQYLSLALDKIQRRLGGKAHAELKTILHTALQQHRNQNDCEQHKAWIARLLFDYYDPMYDYQLNKKSERITFKGNRQQLMQYLGKL